MGNELSGAIISCILGDDRIKYTHIPMMPIRKAYNYLEILMLLSHYNFPNIINAREPESDNNYITVKEPRMDKRLCDLLKRGEISDRKMKSMVVELLNQLILLDNIGFSGIKISKEDVYVDNKLNVFIGDVHRKCFKNRYRSTRGMTYFTILSLFNMFERLITFINPNITYTMTLEEMLLILEEKNLDQMLVESCNDKIMRSLYYQMEGDENYDFSKDIYIPHNNRNSHYCLSDYNDEYSMYRNIIKDSCSKMLKMLELQHLNMGIYKLQFLTVKMQYSKSIKEINLEGNSLGDSGVVILCKYLPNLPNLNTLNLNNNCISRMGVSSIMSCAKYLNKLEFLRLNNNRIGDDSVKIIASNIDNISKIVGIYLDNNFISDVGINYLFPKLYKLKFLFEISLQNNMFHDDGFITILSCLESIYMVLIRTSGNTVKDKKRVNSYIDSDFKREAMTFSPIVY